MGAMPVDLESAKTEYDNLIKSGNNALFAIIFDEEYIGIVGLYSINWIARSAELRIIIGNKTYWNKGYGTDATKLAIRYGFDMLNLNKIWLGVNAEHIGAIRAYEKAGFTQEGILRQEIFRNNRYYDAIRMSILRGEYV